jgi:hypothetical protein
MATILEGMVDDQDVLSNQRVVDMSEKLYLLEPDASPLTSMLMKLNKKNARSTKIEWISNELMPRVTTLAASATSAATTATVATGTGDYFNVGDVWRIATVGMNIGITAVSTDTIGFAAVGSVSAVSAASGVDLVKVGNANAQGATGRTVNITKRVHNYNYTQILRNNWEFTESLLASEQYQSDDLTLERRKKLIEHKAEIEHTLWFGRRDLESTTGYCGGFTDFVTTNVTNVGGGLTSTLFETFLRTGFRYGSKKKVFFAAPLVQSALSSFALGRLAPPSTSISDWGVHTRTYQSGAGHKVDIVYLAEFQDFQTSLTQFGGWGFLVDMDDVRYRPLVGNGRNRDTKMLTKRQENDRDSTEEEYLTEFSFEIGNEKNHAILKGVTAY